MSLPPENIKDYDLFAQITQLPRPYKIVDSPLKLADGSYAPVAIWALTQEEHCRCTASAEEWTQNILKERIKHPKKDEQCLAYDKLHFNRSTSEVLFRAVRRADDINKPFFTDVKSIQFYLTLDQIVHMFNQYNIVMKELGPMINDLTAFEMDLWIDKLKRGSSIAPLDNLSSQMQSQLILYMADHFVSSQMDKSSQSTVVEEPKKSEKKPKKLPKKTDDTFDDETTPFEE
jgi:hypothetical protein